MKSSEISYSRLVIQADDGGQNKTNKQILQRICLPALVSHSAPLALQTPEISSSTDVYNIAYIINN